MITFLFGRPGTGKTYRMVEEIRAHIEAGSTRVYMLVPEQQAYSAERDVLSALPPNATEFFSILSFTRLCDEVEGTYGGRESQHMSRAMKTVLMWENLRSLQGITEYYTSDVAGDASLCRKMLQTAQELKVNAVSFATLEHVADKLPADAPLRCKLRDLALICSSYDGLVSEIYGETAVDRMLRAAEAIDKGDFFQDAVVYIDSFTSFTAQEYAVLRPLFRQAKEVIISVGCSGRMDDLPQFDSMRDSVNRLTRLCVDLNRPYTDELLHEDHRGLPAELRLLGDHLWDFEYSANDEGMLPADERGHVRLVAAEDRYEEAKAASLHILELVQNGVGYGEIAVVVRDTSVWKGILDAAMDDLGIPYFLSERTDILEKPAARLLLTALRCVGRGYQREDIITLCKTGLLGIPARDLDYFQEYTETWQITGKRMTEAAWSMNPDGYKIEMSSRGRTILLAANRVRETVMTPLVELSMKLKTAETVTEECRALYDYMMDLGIREKLAQNAEDLLSREQIREAGELVRLWSFLTETLATVSAAFESAGALSPDELSTVFAMMFADTDIGSVPALHDCVTVGSASTLRVDHMKAVLVLGLCEGEFPGNVSQNSLLSEQEKEILQQNGIELSGRAEQLMSAELMYLWRAVTKPSETLILSYSVSTIDGSVQTPSAAFNRVKYLLRGIEVIPFSSGSMSLTEDAGRYRVPLEDRVSRPTVRRLLGDEIWLSQSKLQTYAHCPYSYYGAQMLSLRGQQDAIFDNLGAGVFLHHVMEQYLRASLDEDNRLRPMEKAEREAVADAIIDAYVEELCGDISRKGRILHLFDRLRAVALVLIESIQEELTHGRFCVAGIEWDTHGRREGDPLPMKLTLDMEVDPDGDVLPVGLGNTGSTSMGAEDPVTLLLGGRIDRVDFYRGEDGKTVFVRVVDYKASRHEFSAKSVTEDMNIQLLLYLFTLCSPENRALFADGDATLPETVFPASAVYISPDETSRDGEILPCRTGVILEDTDILKAANEDLDVAYLPSVKRDRSQNLVGNGLVSRDSMLELENLLKEAILDTARNMYEGDAKRTPSKDACKFCMMKGYCSLCVE